MIIKIAKYCSFDREGEAFIEKAYKALNLSPRSMVKIRKISRTIADLDESKELNLNIYLKQYNSDRGGR